MTGESQFMLPDNPIPDNLNYTQRVMADEVLHKNPTAKILPTVELPDKLPGIEDLFPVHHMDCKNVAFYYTHMPVRGEMLTASRARTTKGKRCESAAPIMCGFCGGNVQPSRMYMDKK